MTYIYRVLREAPSGLWSMDATPVVDSSGYNRHASFTGSPTTTRPIVAGGIASQLLDSGDSVTYPVSNIAVSGRESRSFSLEAWVKPQTGNHKVLARDNSGLFIDGFKLRMSLDFGGTLVSAEYKGIRPGNVYHVVGVYDSTGISLFLNGVKVAGVDIPDETRALGIADTATTLSSSTDTSIVLDSLATYFYPLSYEDVRSHYQQGADYPEVINLSTLNGGKYYEFTDEHVSTYRKSSFPETDAWAEGLFEGTVSVVDDSLMNMYDVATDMYQTGTWTIQESFEVAAGVVLVASRITWNADANITVEKSEDGGTTWTALSNGGQIVSNKSLDIEGYSASIRVTIPASAEQISVSDLTTAFYTSLDAKGSDEDLPAVVRDPASATVAETSFPAAQFNDNAGINLAGASGGLSIAADDAEFGGYFAVEMTVKLSENSANATVLWVDTASAQPQIVTDAGGQWTFANLTALYVDGVSVTSPAAIAPGAWHHVIALFPESLAAIYVGNNVAGTASHAMRIGHLATYSDPVGESDAVAIYKAWTGAPAIQIAEAQVVGVSEKTESSGGLMLAAASSYYDQQILARDGLAAYWKHDDVGATGVTRTMVDATAAHDGTYSIHAVLGAEAEDGTAVQVANNTWAASVAKGAWTDTDYFTFVTNYRPISISGDCHIAGKVNYGDSAQSASYAWWMRRISNGAIHYGIGRTGGLVYTSSPAGVLAANTWHRVALSYNGSQLALWVNGAKVSSIAVTGARWKADNINMTWGADPVGGYPGNGDRFDRSSYYGRALSDSEHLDDFNALSAPPPPPPGSPVRMYSHDWAIVSGG